MLKVGSRLEQVAHLVDRQDIGQLGFPAWIKCTGYYIRHPQDVFVEEATGLGHHSAFIITRPKLLFDKVDIGDDVVLINLFRIFIIVESEQVPHL